MTDDSRARADRNLAEAAARTSHADPRPPLRERLRGLKEEDPAAFARALAHYEEVVLPAIAADDNVMENWVDYGATVAGMTAAGRVLQIDGTGKAVPFRAPVVDGSLVLHVPDENNAAVLVIVAPAAPTPAQQATIDLLVGRSLGLRSA